MANNNKKKLMAALLATISMMAVLLVPSAATADDVPATVLAIDMDVFEGEACEAPSVGHLFATSGSCHTGNTLVNSARLTCGATEEDPVTVELFNEPDCTGAIAMTQTAPCFPGDDPHPTHTLSCKPYPSNKLVRAVGIVNRECAEGETHLSNPAQGIDLTFVLGECQLRTLPSFKSDTYILGSFNTSMTADNEITMHVFEAEQCGGDILLTLKGMLDSCVDQVGDIPAALWFKTVVPGAVIEPTEVDETSPPSTSPPSTSSTSSPTVAPSTQGSVAVGTSLNGLISAACAVLVLGMFV